MRSHNDALNYQRYTEAERFTVALNLTHEARRVLFPERGKIVMSTYLERRHCDVTGFLILRPDEGVIVQMS